MILGFKEINGFKALDANNKRIGEVLNVLVEVADENAYLYVSTLGETGRAITPFTLLLKRDYFIFLKDVGGKSNARRIVNLSSDGIKIRKETKIPQKCDHFNWLVPREAAIPAIHEHTHVYDLDGEWLGIVYDFLLDTKVGKRAGLVIAPPAEMHTPFPEKSPSKTLVIRNDSYSIVRDKVVPYVVVNKNKADLKWVSGLPDYSKIKSVATYESRLEEYINSYLAKGWTPEQIQTTLAQSGWDERDISKVFDEMGF